MKGDNDMKQYTKPDFSIIELFEDLLTISAGGEQGEGVNNLSFDWTKL